MKRNEQLIENTWKIEDIYPNLDVFYKELEKAKTQSKELLKSSFGFSHLLISIGLSAPTSSFNCTITELFRVSTVPVMMPL